MLIGLVLWMSLKGDCHHLAESRAAFDLAPFVISEVGFCAIGESDVNWVLGEQQACDATLAMDRWNGQIGIHPLNVIASGIFVWNVRAAPTCRLKGSVHSAAEPLAVKEAVHPRANVAQTHLFGDQILFEFTHGDTLLPRLIYLWKAKNMNERSHFSYEGNIHIRPRKSEVKSVEFLTPARITLTSNGQETSEIVSIDIINRKVYDAKGGTELSELVFNHLDAINTLPEDFFAASEELHEKVAEVDEERVRQAEEILGEHHE
jgi:hypothetical protein